MSFSGVMTLHSRATALAYADSGSASSLPTVATPNRIPRSWATTFSGTSTRFAFASAALVVAGPAWGSCAAQATQVKRIESARTPAISWRFMRSLPAMSFHSYGIN